MSNRLSLNNLRALQQQALQTGPFGFQAVNAPLVRTPNGLADPNELLSASPSLQGASSPVAANATQGLSGVSGIFNYTGTAPRVVNSNITITGIDTLNGARVLIDNFDASKDRLSINGLATGSENGVNWEYDQARGVLTLSSTSSVSSSIYQGLLRRVAYANTDANNPGNARGIQYSLGSLLANPENGHFYQFVPVDVNDTGISWIDARNAAANPSNNYFGRQGYLATITSATEQEFIERRVSGNGWIGATDQAVEGEWRWVTGPEGTEDSNQGRLFWRGIGADFNNNRANNAGPVGNFYSNWDLANNEPNNNPASGDPNGEDYAHIVGNAGAGTIGKWNDLPNQQNYTNFGVAPYRPQGYIVEYGGLASDTPLTISARVTLNFSRPLGEAPGAAAGTRTRGPNFNDTASPEILWRNYGQGASRGLNAIWTLNYDATNATQAFTLNTDPKLTKFILEARDTGWEIEGLYDVDGNGIDDIFWRNYTTGENGVWLMRFDANTGAELIQGIFLDRVTDVSWEIEGVLNFDENAGPEILWRNYRTGETAIWSYDYNPANTANPLTLNSTRTRFVGAPVDINWYIEGWADFNNDQIPDILWRNYRTGENGIWELNRNATGNNPYLTRGYFISRVEDPLWEVADVIDFDRDGVADILWRNYRTGQNAIWGMTSAGDFNPAKTNFIAQVPDTNWRIEGTGDFTGDDIPDIVWRNYRTGQNGIWRMKLENNRFVYDSGFFIDTVEDLAWEIEGPSPTRDVA
ncbi:MAG: VCBS repeat-containing protein [Calothrix sp. C42_A2020_038]|nr:VCBS repeat-containing protein [Calothrix sp. C42_A2020_038]